MPIRQGVEEIDFLGCYPNIKAVVPRKYSGFFVEKIFKHIHSVLFFV